MPKITLKDLKNIKYKSMVDFSDKIDEIDTMHEKINFATKYLIQYRRHEGEADYTFEEAVHLARLKIGETALKRRKLWNEEQQQMFRDNPQTIDPNLAGSPRDYNNEFFFGNPRSYLLGHMYPLDDEALAKDHLYADHYEDLIDNNFNDKLAAIERNPNALDIRYRLELRIGSKAEEEKAYKDTKPGFFSNLFNTSSKAYKDLETMWTAFNNPNHAMYGDMVGLENAANGYLLHKFPNWRIGDPITNEMLLGLDKTEAARVSFCTNVKAVIKEQRENTVGYKEMLNACENQKISFKDVDKLDPVQNIFQNVLAEDLSEDELENVNEIEQLGPLMEEKKEVEKEDEKEDEKEISNQEEESSLGMNWED